MVLSCVIVGPDTSPGIRIRLSHPTKSDCLSWVTKVLSNLCSPWVSVFPIPCVIKATISQRSSTLTVIHKIRSSTSILDIHNRTWICSNFILRIRDQQCVSWLLVGLVGRASLSLMKRWSEVCFSTFSA